MIEAAVEALIYLAAALAIAGGLIFVPWMLALVLRERREQRALLDDYRRRNAARRAWYVAEAKAAHEVSVRPAPPRRSRKRASQRRTPSRSRVLQRHA